MTQVTGQDVLLVGGTGFVGQSLGRALTRAGFTLRVLARRPERAAAQLTYPARIYSMPNGIVPEAALRGVAAIINLAGESIIDYRGGEAGWRRLVESRVGLTAALAKVAAQVGFPAVYIQASAVGFYGERGDEILTETSAPGVSKLAQLCTSWEAEGGTFAAGGSRTVFLRLGVVLGLSGGALPTLAFAHRPGVGVVVGDPDAWLSWIHEADLTRFIATALKDSAYRGPYNLTAPVPCRWRQFSKALLGGRGVVGGMPKVVARAVLGQGTVLAADSTRVVPQAAQAAGFEFAYQDIDQGIQALLGEPKERHIPFLSSWQFLPRPLDEVAKFFADERNLQEITPPWLSFQVVGKSTPQMGTGTLIDYRLTVHHLPMRWTSRITDWDLPHGFVDEQIKGPYAFWHHRHRFEAVPGGTLVSDLVRYRVPFGRLGDLTIGLPIGHDVKKIFAYRNKAIAARFGAGTYVHS